MQGLRLTDSVSAALVILLIIFIGGCSEPSSIKQVPTSETSEEIGVIELTMGSTWGPDEPDSIAALEWIERIERETNGRVHITPYWGGTVINYMKGQSQVAKGIVDIGHLGNGPGAGSLFWEMGLFFWNSPSQETCYRVYKEISSKFPEIGAEITDVKLLNIGAGTGNVIHSNTPVTSLDDLAGMSIRGTAPYYGLFKSLNAEAIALNMAEVYTSLDKMIIDAAFTPYSTLKSHGFAKVTKYSTEVGMASFPVPSKAMNWDTWNSLPADIQQIIEESLERWDLRTIEMMGGGDPEGIEYAKTLDHEFLELSQADKDKLGEIMEVECMKKAKELDANGLPGTEIYKEIQHLIALYK